MSRSAFHPGPAVVGLAFVALLVVGCAAPRPPSPAAPLREEMSPGSASARRIPAGEPVVDWSRGLRLEDALRLARIRNRGLLEARARTGLSAARLVTARQFPFNPEAGYEVNSDAPFGNAGEGSVALHLAQEFETGNQRRFREEVARAGIRADESGVEETARLLDASVVAAFSAGLQLQRRIGLAEQALDLTKTTLEVGEKRLAASDIAEVQILPIRLDVVRAEGEVQRRRRELAAGKLLLVAAIGEEPRTDFELLGELPGAPSGDLVEPPLRRRMIENRPDLAQLRHRVEEAEAGARLAEAERSPNVRLGLGLERSTSQLDVGSQSVHDRDLLIGISASVPLPLFNRRSGEIAEAQAEIRVNRAELSVREADAIAALSAALERVRSTVERERFLRERVLPLAESTLAAVRKAFEAGEVTTSEVLQAQDRLRTAREEHEDARFEVAAARVALEATVGGPLEPTPGAGDNR